MIRPQYSYAQTATALHLVVRGPRAKPADVQVVVRDGRITVSVPPFLVALVAPGPLCDGSERVEFGVETGVIRVEISKAAPGLFEGLEAVLPQTGAAFGFVGPHVDSVAVDAAVASYAASAGIYCDAVCSKTGLSASVRAAAADARVGDFFDDDAFLADVACPPDGLAEALAWQSPWESAWESLRVFAAGSGYSGGGIGIGQAEQFLAELSALSSASDLGPLERDFRRLSTGRSSCSDLSSESLGESSSESDSDTSTAESPRLPAVPTAEKAVPKSPAGTMVDPLTAWRLDGAAGTPEKWSALVANAVEAMQPECAKTAVEWALPGAAGPPVDCVLEIPDDTEPLYLALVDLVATALLEARANLDPLSGASDNPESCVTMARVSPTLAAAAAPNSLAKLVRSWTRRAVAVPLFRSLDLAVHVLSRDLVVIAALGRPAILHCLAAMHCQLDDDDRTSAAAEACVAPFIAWVAGPTFDVRLFQRHALVLAVAGAFPAPGDQSRLRQSLERHTDLDLDSLLSHAATLGDA